MSGPQPRPSEERFWKFVQKGQANECWLWTGAHHPLGYGRFWDGERVRPAHAVSWEMANNAKVPNGLYVLHSCDNPPCVNPRHLRPDTQAANLHEMRERNRGFWPGNPGARNGRAKLSESDVQKIIKRAAIGKESQRVIGLAYGISQTQVSKILLGQSWTRSHR